MCFASGKALDDAYAKAVKVYKEAYEIANKDIPITNSSRLGLSLNYSVFYYEIRGLREEACTITKIAFDESLKLLDDLEKGEKTEGEIKDLYFILLYPRK